jgi:SsrA-binding protein
MFTYPIMLAFAQNALHYYALSFIGGFLFALVNGAYANYMLETSRRMTVPRIWRGTPSCSTLPCWPVPLQGPLIADVMGLAPALILFRRSARCGRRILLMQGSEIKSIRAGQISIQESYMDVQNGEQAWLVEAHIAPYEQANRFNHEPRRKRRLLLHKKQIRELWNNVRIKGMTIVPTRVYLKDGRAKIEIALPKARKPTTNAPPSPNVTRRAIKNAP